MQITRLLIENFRSIRKLEVELGESTVLIGRNNAGKTAVLDALRIALTRRWGQRGSGFTEYDIHLPDANTDPKLSTGVLIEISVEERAPGEWSEAIQQDLDNIAQIDPATGLTSVMLRVTYAWSAPDDAFMPTWQFLNAARKPLPGVSAKRINLERFWQYLPVFYLSALRDVSEEFSPRSQFWGRLLKAIQIPPALEKRVYRILVRVNRRLLAADPRLKGIADTLSGATRIAAKDRTGSADLQLMPLQTWDLLSKAEIILRNENTWPWLPIKQHGQGLQSLSVMFLFQAFVEYLLKEIFEADSTPLLALEEPETHLHPQAARTLWHHVSKLAGQKIVTTHSPYFVQHVPFRDLRLLRLTESGTEIRWLPKTFSAIVPVHPPLLAVVAGSGGTLKFDTARGRLEVNGRLEEPLYRRLLTCYGGHADMAKAHAALRALRDESAVYVSDADLQGLDTYARRIRGEIFFADRWLLVEGQAEYALVSGLAEALGTPLDDFGIALIDAVNNGNPQTFALLARALNIPWVAVLDGDAAGRGYKAAMVSRGFDQALIDERCRLLPAGDLEQQLIADGAHAELRAILAHLGKPDANTCDLPALIDLMRNSKTDYSAELARRVKETPALAHTLLQPVREAIEHLRGL